MLGPVRFDHIERCTRDTLDKGDFVTGKRTASGGGGGGSSTGKIIVNGCQVNISKINRLMNDSYDFCNF